MTLSEWVEKYCEDNDITLPDGIPDEKTALQFLNLNASGGGNPNSVQVIEGTLANPFGNVDISELYSALTLNNANAQIVMDFSVLGITDDVTAPFYIDTNITNRFAVTVANGDENQLSQAAIFTWQEVGTLRFATMYAQDGSGTDIISYASSIPTTLTIYRHPIPENN